MATPPSAMARGYYGAWALGFLVILICILAIIGVPIPSDPKTFFALIGALGLAIFFVRL